MKVLIITALRIEYQAVRNHLKNIQEVTISDFVLEKGIAKNCDIAEIYIRESGAGNKNSAISTDNLTREIRPDLTMFIGIAGSIKDLKIGDIIIAEKVYGYLGGKSSDSFKARPELGKSTKKIFERAKAEAKKNDWKKELNPPYSNDVKVITGNIASGDIVLTSNKPDNTFREIINDHYNDTHAIEMEGIGFMAGFHNYNKGECIVLRGISDYADPNKNNENENSNQKEACRLVAGFGFHLIKKYIKNEDRKKDIFPHLTFGTLGIIILVILINSMILIKPKRDVKNEADKFTTNKKDTVKEKINQENTIKISGSNNNINNVSMKNETK